MNDIIKYIQSYISKRKNRIHKNKLLKKYGAITYCECGEISQENSTCKVIDTDGFYSFTCNSCGLTTYFQYGIAPVPLKADKDGNIL